MPTSFGESFPYNRVHQVPSQVEAGLPLHRTSSQLELRPFSSIDKEVDATGHWANSEGDHNKKALPVNIHDLPVDPEKRAVSPTSTSEDLLDDPQMGRRTPNSRIKVPDRPISTASGGQNGHANGDMGSHLEMRRKDPSLEYPTAASQTAHLMGRENFSLDDEPPPTPMTPNPNASLFDLPRQDRRNFLLLVLLYFLQGIPMGLAGGSVPFLLKSHLSYGQIGVFSLASYPYSLKLLWSPIVDAVWSPALGRRKSWIMPIQICSGLGMIYLGGRIKDMMIAAGANDGAGVWNFTRWWFFLVFLCATQDIAVDGRGPPSKITLFWELTVISRLGSYTPFPSKSILRFHCPNGWPNCWPFLVIYSLLSIQLASLRQ